MRINLNRLEAAGFHVENHENGIIDIYPKDRNPDTEQLVNMLQERFGLGEHATDTVVGTVLNEQIFMELRNQQ